jgi:hypothetical protein
MSVSEATWFARRPEGARCERWGARAAILHRSLRCNKRPRLLVRALEIRVAGLGVAPSFHARGRRCILPAAPKDVPVEIKQAIGRLREADHVVSKLELRVRSGRCAGTNNRKRARGR